MSFDRKNEFLRTTQKWQHVREGEGKLFERIGWISSHKHKVLEIGSGTGVLTKNLNRHYDKVHTIDNNFEGSKYSDSHWKHDASRGLPTDVYRKSYSSVISLATAHHLSFRDSGRHIPEKLLKDCWRVLNRKGQLAIADVAWINDEQVSNSSATGRTARFFSKVIDKYSSPSHEGHYLSSEDMIYILRKVGFKECEVKEVDSFWKFKNRLELGKYIKSMFNLSIRASMVKDLAEEIIGVEDEGDTKKLKWGLIAIKATK